MRLALCWMLLLCSSLPLQAEEEALYTLAEGWQRGFAYTTVETDTVSSTTTFEVKQRNDTLRLSGGVTDKHTRTITTVPTTFDDAGATRLAVAVPSHTLTRTELPPGESASRVAYNGKGAFSNAAWNEEWKDGAWKRTPVKPGDSRAGQFPEEFKQAMAVRRNSRGHYLLPNGPVAVGATWKPDASHLLSQFKQFARGDEAPELELACKLEKVEDGRAVIQFTWSAKGLKPVKTDSGSFWKDDTKVEVEGTATLTLHIEHQLIEKLEAKTTAKLSGSLWDSGKWLPASATLKFERSASTTRAPE